MQLSAMRARVSSRLAEAAAPVFYPAAEITAALNEAQRFFCLLTLGLEKTDVWTLAGPTPTFTHMLTVFPDWICALRITDGAGAKVRPMKLADITCLDPGWIASAGPPVRYVSAGADFVGLYQQPAGGGFLNVTYARAPVALVADGDVPEIPAEYHPRLVEYAIYRCRQVEGGQEFQKSLRYFSAFLAGAKHYADYVRERNRGEKYDVTPFELESYNLAELMEAQ